MGAEVAENSDEKMPEGLKGAAADANKVVNKQDSHLHNRSCDDVQSHGRRGGSATWQSREDPAIDSHPGNAVEDSCRGPEEEHSCAGVCSHEKLPGEGWWRSLVGHRLDKAHGQPSRGLNGLTSRATPPYAHWDASLTDTSVAACP